MGDGITKDLAVEVVFPDFQAAIQSARSQAKSNFPEIFKSQIAQQANRRKSNNDIQSKNNST